MSIDLGAMIGSAIYSGFTLYMLLILVRWLGPYIELDFYDTRLRWIARAVDPLLRAIRGIVPAVGPMDVGPLIAVLLLWLIRTVAIDIVTPPV
ncbi:MAG: YggT family protein [Candidatus Hydrogenedentes bacterium]|nr:YggT family protein [Candidatus Hydrogenedentota bacterium]